MGLCESLRLAVVAAVVVVAAAAAVVVADCTVGAGAGAVEDHRTSSLR